MFARSKQIVNELYVILIRADIVRLSKWDKISWILLLIIFLFALEQVSFIAAI